MHMKLEGHSSLRENYMIYALVRDEDGLHKKLWYKQHSVLFLQKFVTIRDTVETGKTFSILLFSSCGGSGTL